MRRINNKSIFVIFTMFIYIFASFFLIKSFNNLYFKVINPIFWGLLFGVSLFFFKGEYVNKKYRYDILLNIVIYLILFFIVYYVAGFLSGFQKTPYDNSIKGIIVNIWSYGIVIFFQEYIRKVLINRTGRNIYLVFFITALFISFDLSKVLVSYDFSSFEKVFQFVIISLNPILVKNILLSYLTYVSDYIPPIIYRFLLEIFSYVVPFIPNFNWFLMGVINLVFPILTLIGCYRTIKKRDNKTEYRRLKRNNLVYVPILSVLLVIAILVSGVFKYQLMAIASNSMNPVFYRGDAVVMQRLKSDDLSEIKIGDILVFESDKRIVVHRVIAKEQSLGGKTLYQTKGDNNNAPDSELVDPSNIVGKFKFGIKFIGYPSVVLQELISKL